MIAADLLRVPDPLDCDVAAARYYHDDLAELDGTALVRELRRCDVAVALAERGDGQEWHLTRRAAVSAELASRGWRA